MKFQVSDSISGKEGDGLGSAVRLDDKSIAVTNWGCGCCKGDDDRNCVAAARLIVAALNFAKAQAAAGNADAFRIFYTYEMEKRDLVVPSWSDYDD